MTDRSRVRCKPVAGKVMSAEEAAAFIIARAITWG